MTRRRWIADEVNGNRATLVGDHARHLARVLRAQAGQQFQISTGDQIRQGTVIAITPERVEFELSEVISTPTQSPISVAISVFKFDRMEWAIEKCTELGVARIIPVIAARTEPHLASAAPKRLERWKRIAHSASEQSRRIAPPDIAEPVKIKELIAMAASNRIVLSEVEDELMLKDAAPANPGSLILAFGPEGGWKQEELDQFCESGWTAASLGPAILRVETAVISAVAIAASVLMAKA